ncbi:MAG: hypothetical protein LBS31_05270, partial [Candidatus Adiutrix sp.]|nr:hypothetical protein [Candidatus Adiutrix sp.]
FRDEALRDWEKIISAAHAAGVAVIPQLWHGRPTEEGGAAGPAPDRPEAARRRASSWAEEYARAAGRIRQIGFDGLELHGGGKHTADLFSLAPGEDKPERPARRDRYERPAAADIIEAARSAVGPDFPIIVRISEQRRLTQTPFARDEAELLALLRPCVEAGADMFHLEATDGLSRRNGEAPSAEGSFAARVGGLLRLPVIAAGQIAVADAAETAKRLRLLAPAAARGDIALLALGRALLADPDWVNKLRAGRLDTAVGYEEKMLERLF